MAGKGNYGQAKAGKQNSVLIWEAKPYRKEKYVEILRNMYFDTDANDRDAAAFYTVLA